MDNLGFIHEKLDIKILILFILSKLSSEIDVNTLYDLCRCDGGVGYFEFADCLGELVESEHVKQDESCLIITEKGKRNVDAVSSSLPYSVRVKAEAAAQPINDALVRKSLIKADHSFKDGSCFTNLSLSDGVGQIMELSFLCSDEQQALEIENKFKNDAEKYYEKIIGIFSGE